MVTPGSAAAAAAADDPRPFPAAAAALAQTEATKERVALKEVPQAVVRLACTS